MSLNDLIQPTDQPWLNAYVNNLTIYGTQTGGGGSASVSWVPQLQFNGSSTGITYVVPPTATSNQIGNLVFIN